jgi:hypothetical protein
MQALLPVDTWRLEREVPGGWAPVGHAVDHIERGNAEFKVIQDGVHRVAAYDRDLRLLFWLDIHDGEPIYGGYSVGVTMSARIEVSR